MSRLTRTAVLASALLALPATAGAAPTVHRPMPAKHRSIHAKPHARHRKGAAKTMSYLARVVSSGPAGVVLRTPSGRTVKLRPSQVSRVRPAPGLRHKHVRRTGGAHRATDISLGSGGVSVNVFGLQPGVTVLVTISVDGDGHPSISITLPPPAPGVTTGLTSTGVVSDLSEEALTVADGDGSSFRLHLPADKLAPLGLEVCDTVAATYHQDAGLLIADTVTKTGHSSEGDCAPGQEEQKLDAAGLITAIAPTGLTIAPAGGAPMSFVTDAGFADGYKVGDLVDVVYTQAGDTLTASEISFVQSTAAGKVVAVDDASMTVIDSTTGERVTYVADPQQGTLDGVALHDTVQLTYHHSGDQLVVDCVRSGSSDS